MHGRELKRLEALAKSLGSCKDRMEELCKQAASGGRTKADHEEGFKAVAADLASLLESMVEAREGASSGDDPIGWFEPEEDDVPGAADGCGPEDYLQGSIDKLLDAVSAYACIESHVQTAINLASRSLRAWGESTAASNLPDTRVYPVEVELCYHKVVGVRARSEAEALEAASQYGTDELEPDDSCRIEGDGPTIAPDEYLDEGSKILQA